MNTSGWFGLQYLAQRHSNMQIGGDQITDPLIGGQPTLSPEPQKKGELHVGSIL